MNSLNLISYLIVNAFHIYIFYLVFRVFFGLPRVKKKIEWLCYGLFYLLNSVAFIFVGNPFLNLATSVFPLFLLTTMYNGDGWSKLLPVVFSCLGSMLCELISFNLLRFLGMLNTVGSQTLGNLMASLPLFAAVLIYKQARQGRAQKTLEFAHWLTIIILPVGSMVIAALIYSEAVDTAATLVIIMILLGMNVLVFYLYDRLDEYYLSSYEQRRLQQQNDTYLHELEIMKTSNDNIRVLRHDLKNHFFTATQLLVTKKYDELGQLFSDINGVYFSPDKFVDTGNPELDSILNLKLDEASRLGADLDVDIKVPQQLSITSLDISMILGNVLDNAIEAIAESPSKKLKVHIFLDRGMLIFHIRNTYYGKREKVILGEVVSYQSKKKQPELHGLGLQSIRRAVEKYDGHMVISDSDGLFDVNIMVYLP